MLIYMVFLELLTSGFSCGAEATQPHASKLSLVKQVQQTLAGIVGH